ELAARGADTVVIGEKRKYLRGRDPAELVRLLSEGAATVGMTDVPSHPGELAALQALVPASGPGDVVALMAPAERAEVQARLAHEGGDLAGARHTPALPGGSRAGGRRPPAGQGEELRPPDHPAARGPAHGPRHVGRLRR